MSGKCARWTRTRGLRTTQRRNVMLRTTALIYAALFLFTIAAAAGVIPPPALALIFVTHLIIRYSRIFRF